MNSRGLPEALSSAGAGHGVRLDCYGYGNEGFWQNRFWQNHGKRQVPETGKTRIALLSRRQRGTRLSRMLLWTGMDSLLRGAMDTALMARLSNYRVSAAQGWLVS
jgi:hypothetical protein